MQLFDLFSKSKLNLFLLLMTLFVLTQGRAQNQSVKRNSYIINMGIVPQTFGNGLRPYGLVYDLLTNYNVPVKWVINPNKVKDGTDFHHNNIFYKGGAFVIDSAYLSVPIKAVIANWNVLGVIGAYTAYDTVLPVYGLLAYWPKAVMDPKNGTITTDYMGRALIPTTAPAAPFITGLPALLGSGCYDLYVMTHADPTWANYSPLYDFTRNQKGYVWANCHSVSVMESLKDPLSAKRLNFLSTNGLKCYDNGACLPLVSEFHAKNGDPTNPIQLTASLAADPLMQFVGDPLPATVNGSERWYIPTSSSSWNPDTKQYYYSADGTGQSKGMKAIAGYAFGNSNYGRVAYEAGHNHQQTGEVFNKVAAIRMFFNFLLLTGLEKKVQVAMSVIPTETVMGNTIRMSAVASSGNAPYTYSWSSDCGLIISNPTAATTNITFPNTPVSNCRITVRVTDACGRKEYAIRKISLTKGIVLPEEHVELKAVLQQEQVHLQWNQPAGSSYTQFELERSYDGNHFSTIATKFACCAHYTATDQPDVQYPQPSYRIKLTEGSKISYSNTVAVRLPVVTRRLQVSPNPVRHTLSIHNAQPLSWVHIAITDQMGHLIQQDRLYCRGTELSIPLSGNLHKGIYFITLNQGGATTVLKFVKE
jgi:hypothetical protein